MTPLERDPRAIRRIGALLQTDEAIVDPGAPHSDQDNASDEDSEDDQNNFASTHG